MGAMKRAMFEDDSVALMATLKELNACMRMAVGLQAAMTAIVGLHPADTNEGDNEWGEAECYHRARQIARNALNALNKEINDGSV